MEFVKLKMMSFNYSKSRVSEDSNSRIGASSLEWSLANWIVAIALKCLVTGDV